MTNDTHSPSTRTTSFWAWVPVLLLGSMFVGLGSMAYVAVNDPGFALEPNYYDKAVHWDRSQAEASASRQLGLKVEVSQPLALTDAGKLELQLTIHDRQGASFAGAQVQVEAFANARASRIEHVTLSEAAPGVYRAEIAHGLPGLWELRLDVRRGAELYREVLRRDVGKGDAA